MKKFLIFAFDCYYPSGGMNDFVDSSDSLGDALKVARKIKKSRENVEIYDRDTCEKVWEN